MIKLLATRLAKSFLFFAVPALILVLLNSSSPVGQAAGGGCLDADVVSIEGSEDLVSYTDTDGNTIDGVCIKSGTNMFNGEGHSGEFGNGLYEDNCYLVTGVGTSIVVVTRIGEDSPSCQGISHIDVYLSDPSPTPTESPSPTPTESPSPTPTEEPTSTPTETPTDEPTATPTETPRETESPTPTPTESPSPTPTEEPTSTPTSTPTLSPAGPTETGGGQVLGENVGQVLGLSTTSSGTNAFLFFLGLTAITFGLRQIGKALFVS